MSNIQLIENLRRLRADSNLTQQQLSKKLNISRQAYSNYETGLRVPDLCTVILLADFYHVTLDQLILQPLSGKGVINESHGPYYPGMVIESADTIYLSREETELLTHYRSASQDDRRLVKKVLGLPEETPADSGNSSRQKKKKPKNKVIKK